MARFSRMKRRFKKHFARTRQRFSRVRKSYGRFRTARANRRFRRSGSKHHLMEYAFMAVLAYLVIHNWAKIKSMITGRPTY